MPNRMLKKQMQMMQGINMLKGVHDYYRLKMGYKPQPYQVEQPSSVNVNTVPEYLQTRSSNNAK